MTTIIVPDDEPSILAGTAQEDNLKKLGNVQIYRSRVFKDEELLSRVANADIVFNIRATSVFNSNVLSKCQRLKLISIFGVGYDNVDIKVASELGIKVTNTPGYSSVAVAEMALALTFAAARQLVQNDSVIRNGGWAKRYSSQLFGNVLGIIGTGNIGRRMIQLGKSIGMKVIAWTPHPSPERASEYGVNFVALDELLRRSDVVSLHLAAVPETRHLIGKREIGIMKPNALLINTARGSLVNEEALMDALQKGIIAGAGLDVFAIEPLPPNHPFRQLQNVVLSPHTAAMVPAATLAGLSMAVNNIENFIEGHPTNALN